MSQVRPTFYRDPACHFQASHLKQVPWDYSTQYLEVRPGPKRKKTERRRCCEEGRGNVEVLTVITLTVLGLW